MLRNERRDDIYTASAAFAPRRRLIRFHESKAGNCLRRDNAVRPGPRSVLRATFAKPYRASIRPRFGHRCHPERANDRHREFVAAAERRKTGCPSCRHDEPGCCTAMRGEDAPDGRRVLRPRQALDFHPIVRKHRVAGFREIARRRRCRRAAREDGSRRDCQSGSQKESRHRMSPNSQRRRNPRRRSKPYPPGTKGANTRLRSFHRQPARDLRQSLSSSGRPLLSWCGSAHR